MSSAANKRIIPGMKVFYDAEPYHVKHILDIDEAVLVKLDTLENVCVKLSLIDIFEPLSAKHPEILNLTDKQWNLVQFRYQVIETFLDDPERTREDVTIRASEHNIHTNTIYNWLKKYETSGLLTSLLPKPRKDTGDLRISDEVEEIIHNTIEKEYKNPVRKSVANVCNEVERLCAKQGLKRPHRNTIRNRIKELNAKDVMKSRYSVAEAAHHFRVDKGPFPHADGPMRVIQIDHTKLDIILVDDIHRIQIGRPWITLAMCVWSRMVSGIWIGFEAPGALSTGLCISNGILTKDKYLEKTGVEGSWPCWGVPKTIHADNAKEFRGSMLKMACAQHNIKLEWRPVGRPEYGAHIERLLGTFLKEIHTLPGTTSSNIASKGSYKPMEKAALTLGELSAWLGNYIVNVYHQRDHSGIGMPPILKYKQGILGSNTEPGIGVMAKVADEERLKLDFLPHFERTVQNYGLVWNKIHYFHAVLKPWVNSLDEKQDKYKRKFIFKYDPRDISVIFFYEPELKEYFRIPYRNTARPVISVWELREVNAYLKKQNEHAIDEALIFKGFETMKKIEEDAVLKTSKARRNLQKRNQTTKRRSKNKSQSKNTPTFQGPPKDVSHLTPFNDIDEDF